VVEGQHVVSTRRLVDSLEEHEVLERALDRNKPAVPSECGHLHYLLATPFRYPPLKYGSRFGTRRERGIWYGAESLETALAETAFYRLWFLADSAAELAPIETELTAFRVRVTAGRAVDLTAPPFDAYRERISSPTAFADPQRLGSEMRAAGVEAFRYASARHPGGVCVGVFRCNVFAGAPSGEQHWHCFADIGSIEFSRALTRESHAFSIEQFLVDGELAPRPC